MDGGLEALLAAEAGPRGGFRSWIHTCEGELADENCFVTAHVLRNVDEAGAPRATSRALDFLETCRASGGGFSFWPRGAEPDGFPRLPPDVDDTALAVLELTRYGRMSRREAREIALTVIAPAGRSGLDRGPGWIVPGSFVTWLPNGDPNPVDCTANANVIALLAELGLTYLCAYTAACETVVRGIAWAGASPRRAALLSPFYPDPVELRLAVEDAVRRGARGLRPALDSIARVPWGALRFAPTAPVCSDAYGRTTWTAPVLQTVRALAARNRTDPGGRTARRAQDLRL